MDFSLIVLVFSVFVPPAVGKNNTEDDWFTFCESVRKVAKQEGCQQRVQNKLK